jgi:GTP pyrophosphokinase
MNDLEILQNLRLAPWIFKSTALIGSASRVGGNQFRHNFSTLAILINYGYTDPVLLKASVIHDVLEEPQLLTLTEIRDLDEDGPAVLELIREVTWKKEVHRYRHLEKILESGTKNAKILNCADRISNLTDLPDGVFSEEEMNDYLDETGMFYLSMAKEVNSKMLVELKDLLDRRRALIRRLHFAAWYTPSTN